MLDIGRTASGAISRTFARDDGDVTGVGVLAVLRSQPEAVRVFSYALVRGRPILAVNSFSSWGLVCRESGSRSREKGEGQVVGESESSQEGSFAGPYVLNSCIISCLLKIMYDRLLVSVRVRLRGGGCTGRSRANLTVRILEAAAALNLN